MTYAFEKIAEKEGITDALKETFDEEKANKILSSAEYLLVSECEPVDDFNYFHEAHNHIHGSDISSADFSRLFASITEEDVDNFFKNLNKKTPPASARMRIHTTRLTPRQSVPTPVI